MPSRLRIRTHTSTSSISRARPLAKTRPPKGYELSENEPRLIPLSLSSNRHLPLLTTTKKKKKLSQLLTYSPDAQLRQRTVTTRVRLCFFPQKFRRRRCNPSARVSFSVYKGFTAVAARRSKYIYVRADAGEKEDPYRVFLSRCMCILPVMMAWESAPVFLTREIDSVRWARDVRVG